MTVRARHAALVSALLHGFLLLAPQVTWAASSVYLEELTTADVSATEVSGGTDAAAPTDAPKTPETEA